MWPIFRPVAVTGTALGQRPTATGSEVRARPCSARDLRRNSGNVELACDGGGDERLAMLLEERDLVDEGGVIADRLGLSSGHAGFGSLGSPKTRSLKMLRWIWLVPPQIVSEREKKNDEIIGDTG